MSVRVLIGDCLNVLPTLDDDSFHACVTDPPYHLTSIVKRFGADNAAPAHSGKTGVYARSSAGFMGKQWDGGDVAMRPETWAEVNRVLQPGAHLLAFGGTRTFHRVACAIEDAGFEIRDTISWLYGSGFPKSHNLNGDWQGWGTALKPAWEPIIMARKPLSESSVARNVLRHGTGAINVDGCRVEGKKTPAPVGQFAGSVIGPEGHCGYRDGSSDHLGRWPANVCHDGSENVERAFAVFNAPGQQATVRPDSGAGQKTDTVYGVFATNSNHEPRGDTGTPSRFFYSGKAGPDDRLNSKHPTVKPVALMRWLVRMVTPSGGRVLDPFAGSGTTGMACIRESFDCTLIERETDYVADIQARLDHITGADTPLFAEVAAE